MVQVAVAGDTTEADEIQKLLHEAGIESQLEPAPEDDAYSILVSEESVEEAHDAIEAMTEPDDLIADA
jgi:type III secretory pathway lipoprotein EscJ